MKPIMESWKNFLLEQEEYSKDKKSVLYLGSGGSQEPKRFLENKKYLELLEAWKEKNRTDLEVRSYLDKKSFEGDLDKIIGFSAGAYKAILLAQAHPEADLVLLDPWISLSSKKFLQERGTSFEYHGPSSYLLSRPNAKKSYLKDSLVKLGLMLPTDSGSGHAKSFSHHMQYLLNYFKKTN